MNTSELRALLEDETSRAIFDARIDFKTDKRLSIFYNHLKSTEEKYNFREVEAFIQKFDIDEFYIWGKDDYALYSYRVLVDNGYKVMGLLDISQGGLDGVECFAWKDVIENLNECAVIVFERNISDVPKYILDNCKTLCFYSHVVGRCGKQYFDYLRPWGKEYFVDAGALDGATTTEFLKWCDGNYGAVYAFEVNPLMLEECDKNLRNSVEKSRLFFWDYALWDKRENVMFDNSESKWSAHIDSNGQNLVKADTIDNLLGDKIVTYIKFDIEGSELKALYGAKNCILKNRPRMAVSVYHNENDMEKIMEYLHALNSDYHFVLRHYHSDAIETILYVF